MTIPPQLVTGLRTCRSQAIPPAAGASAGVPPNGLQETQCVLRSAEGRSRRGCSAPAPSPQAAASPASTTQAWKAGPPHTPCRSEEGGQLRKGSWAALCPAPSTRGLCREDLTPGQGTGYLRARLPLHGALPQQAARQRLQPRDVRRRMAAGLGRSPFLRDHPPWRRLQSLRGCN